MNKIIIVISVTLLIISSLIPAGSTLNSINNYTTLSTPVGVAPTLDGIPSDWPTPPSLHPHVVLDGDPSDWYTEKYPIPDDQVTRDNAATRLDPYNPLYVWDYGNGNKYTYYRGEFIWFDAIGDQRTGFVNRYDADITEIRVTSNATHLLVLVRLRDLGAIGEGPNSSIAITLALDTDLNYHNGNTLLLDGKTHTPSYAPWDYQVLVDLANQEVRNKKLIRGDGIPVSAGGSPLDIYNSSMSEVSTTRDAFIADSANNCVEIALYWGDIGVEEPWNVSNVRLFAGVYLSDGLGSPTTNLPHSEYIDVLSNTDTDDEVSDGVLNAWVDIGFNRLPEPVYFSHWILDDKGYEQHWSDLTNDTRTDYIPSEAFDTDILSITTWMNSSNLDVLIHIKGNVKPEGNVSPLIVLVIDQTISNESDGVGPLIEAPPGYGSTDTYLGGINQRGANYTLLVWIDTYGDRVIVMAPGNRTYQYIGGNYIAYSYHYIEASIPLSSIGPLNPPFRIEGASYAVALPGAAIINPPTIVEGRIIDLTGANAYDTIAPYLTYGSGIAYGFAVNGEFYGEEDEYIDTHILDKIATRLINVAINYVSYDNDSYIEIGEPARADAILQYWNGTAWAPLPNRSVAFYLLGSLVPLGSAETDANGTADLDLDDIARNPNVPSGTYRLKAVYRAPIEYVEGYSVEDYIYSSAENTSNTTYTILNRPFIQSLPEPSMAPLLLVAAVTVFILLGRRCCGSHG